MKRKIKCFAFAVLALTSTGIAAQRIADTFIDLPEGIKTNSLDLGPSGDIVVSQSPGLSDSYHVYELRNSSDFTGGSFQWQGLPAGELHCYAKKCIQLSSGRYAAHFTIKNIDPKVIATAVGQAFDVNPELPGDRFREETSKRMAQVANDLMDSVELTYFRIRSGKQVGKPKVVTYSIDWNPSRPDLKAKFLSAFP